MFKSEESKKIYQAIRFCGSLTKRETAKRCGFSLTKTTLLIEEMLENGSLTSFSGKSNGGRIPQLFKIKSGSSYSVGIDIGTKFRRAIIVDSNDKIASAKEWDSNFKKPDTLTPDNLVKRIREMVKHIGIEESKIKAYGISITGIVEEKEGICYSLRNVPNWKMLPIRDKIMELTNIPYISVIDSSRAMAISEQRYGGMRDIKDFILLNIGFGLGLGIIINGKLISCERGTTGEIGHMHLRPSTELCVCGNVGCLEATASGWATLKKCQEGIKSGVETIINSQNSPEELTLTDIISAANQGDRFVCRILDKMAKDIAIALGSVINLFNPEKVILSGGLTRALGNLITNTIVREVKSAVIPWIQKSINIETSKLDKWDAALGAATIALDRAIEEL